MPRYVIQRNLGNVTMKDVEAVGKKSKEVREAKFPDIRLGALAHRGDGQRNADLLRLTRRPTWSASSALRGNRGCPPTRCSPSWQTSIRETLAAQKRRLAKRGFDLSEARGEIGGLGTSVNQESRTPLSSV